MYFRNGAYISIAGLVQEKDYIYNEWYISLKIF